jgi:hypothetical protein
MIIIGDQVIALAAGPGVSTRQSSLKAERPQSTEGVALTPAAGGEEATTPAPTTAH